jgi:hypothetical protein
MNKIILVVIVFVFMTNSVFSQIVKDTCEENLKFKNYFLNQISIIGIHSEENEKNYPRTILDNEFLDALDIIDLYTPVTRELIYTYKGLGYLSWAFEEEKARWLEWYEQNKCKNIKKHRRRFYRPKTLKVINEDE